MDQNSDPIVSQEQNRNQFIEEIGGSIVQFNKNSNRNRLIEGIGDSIVKSDQNSDRNRSIEGIRDSIVQFDQNSDRNRSIEEIGDSIVQFDQNSDQSMDEHTENNQNLQIQEFVEEEIDIEATEATATTKFVPATTDPNSRTIPINASLEGVTRSSLNEMYDLYRDHGKAVGFSIRKGKERTTTHDKETIVEKFYLCSAAGKRIKNSEVQQVNERKRRKVVITRTDCQAHMRVKLNKDALYEVMKHSLDHNHELIRTEMSHLLRSSRQITEAAATEIETFNASGIKPTQSYRYMVQEAGGPKNIGHTLKDHMNYVNRLKRNAIEGGDVENMYEMMQEQEREETGFFYRVKMDKEEKLVHVFWRDSMMKDDYEIFGDVLVFDTTYRTNKYDLICAPFVGLNHHWKNVMYGCALLSDEKIETFEWVFTTFKKAMGGKSPITIFTDQDHAISTALERVFPQSKHRLCIWHLHQNAVNRIGKLKKSKKFKETFNKCLTGCVDELDFEKTWEQMLTTYNLKNDTWFKRLYNLKEKWCTGLNKDFFSAGLLSSQRSEATNSTLTFNAKKTTTLSEFYEIFKKVVKQWREKEMLDEFQCSKGTPDNNLKISGMVEHAAQVYTLKNFETFEDEFIEGISCPALIVHVDGTVMVYDVKTADRKQTYQVLFDYERMLISCACKKYEEVGFLCSHALRVMHINSVERIPEIYIKKRWTKTAKIGLWEKYNKRKDSTNDSNPWRAQITRRLNNAIAINIDTEGARNIMDEATTKIEMDITAYLNSMKGDAQPESSSNSILDPDRAVTKGRKQRKKSHLEKTSRKNKSSSRTSDPTEIGSKTPNVRLF